LLHRDLDIHTPNHMIASFYSENISLWIANFFPDSIIDLNGQYPNSQSPQEPAVTIEYNTQQPRTNILFKALGYISNAAVKLNNKCAPACSIFGKALKISLGVTKPLALASFYYPYALIQHYLKIAEEIKFLEKHPSLENTERLKILQSKLKLTKNENLAWRNSPFACI